LILIRHRVEELQDTRAGKKLLDVPGYRFQALVTSLPVATHPPLSVWRYYNGRADCENVIKELREGFALPTICLDSFWATEAALVLATLTYNLDRPVPAASGMANQSDHPLAAILAFYHRWGAELSTW